MSKADELFKLDALRKSGVLTQEEFDAEKANLLGGAAPLVEPGSPSEAGTSPGTGSFRSPEEETYPSPSPEVLGANAVPSSADQARPASSETDSESEDRHSNTSLIVVVGIVVVVAIAVGASLLLVKGSPSKSSNNAAAQANLQIALTGADTVYTNNNQSYSGIYGGSSGVSSITAVDTGLDFVPGSVASTNVGTVSVENEGSGEVVVLTAYAACSRICFGVLNVMGTDALPGWLADGYTGVATGTYYFQISQASAGNCKATNASAAQTLNPNGW